MAEKIVLSKIKCSMCKSKTLILTESWKHHSIQWDVENGKFDLNDGTLNAGDPFCLHAECACGHKWKIRGAIQISDAIKD